MAKRKRSKTPSRAEREDRHDLYQRAVQMPEADVDFFRRVYKSNFGHMPAVLREDFCGTFALCCEWVNKGSKKRAIGVDLDGPTLDWGREHNLSKISSKAQRRITIYQDDVRTVQGDKADIVAAQNFSYSVFKKRTELRDYIRAAYDNLKGEGIFMMDLLGGHLVIQHDYTVEKRKLKGFTYVWEQEYFKPITAEVLYHIHFRFKDGSEIKKAFTYDWRLWTIPELRELMEEVGFAHSDVYWEGTDPDTNEGDGVYEKTTDPDNDPAWVSYIVGVKR